MPALTEIADRIWVYSVGDGPVSGVIAGDDGLMVVDGQANARAAADLSKQIAKLEKELAGAAARLKNPSFVEKAPAEVVEKARQQADAQARTLNELKAQQDKIRAL